jgi:signal transduction histidine kinase
LSIGPFTGETKEEKNYEKYQVLNETLEQRVTERTAELENRTQQLQQLAMELSDAEGRERRHIASILHDDFQQRLACVNVELSIFLKNNADKEVGKKLGLLKQLIGECVENSCHLSYEINPPALHRNGLLAALDALAQDMKDNHGLRLEIQDTAWSRTQFSHAGIDSVPFRQGTAFKCG